MSCCMINNINTIVSCYYFKVVLKFISYKCFVKSKKQLE